MIKNHSLNKNGTNGHLKSKVAKFNCVNIYFVIRIQLIGLWSFKRHPALSIWWLEGSSATLDYILLFFFLLIALLLNVLASFVNSSMLSRSVSSEVALASSSLLKDLILMFFKKRW